VIIFLSLLGFISFTVFLKTWSGWFLLPTVLISFYLYQQHKKIILTLYAVMMVVFTASLFIQQQQPSKNPTQLIIIESRRTYAIGLSGLKRYHLKQDEQNYFAVGDVLKISSTIEPLIFLTYESTFDFKQYLHSKGVYHRLSIQSYSPIFVSPLRILEHQQSYLVQFPSSLQPYVSQLLFNYSEGESINSIYLIFVSGLGFSMMFDILKSFFKKFFPTWSYASFLFLFPYVLMHIHRFSIVRVFIFKGIDHLHITKPYVFSIKMTMIYLFLLFFPHVVYQTGFYLYILYQFFFKFLVQVIPRFPLYYKTIALWVYTSIVQHLFFHSITPLSIIIYLPLSYINSLLSLSLLTSYYLRFHHFFINTLLSMYKAMMEGVTFISFQISLPQWSISFLLLLGTLVLLFMLGLHYQSKKTMKFSVISLVFIYAFHLAKIPEGWIEKSIHFINVGQGDATLIRQGRNNVLIDTGGQRNIDIATAVLIPYFRKIGVHQLDAVIITHGDFDHDGALPSLAANFRVKEVVRQRFTSFKIGSLHLFQWNHEYYEDENDNSLVLSWTLNQCSILLMGDASIEVEADVLTHLPNQKYDVLRIGHHGSLTSTSEVFLDSIQPNIAIISVSATNRYGHPHSSVMERLSTRGIETKRTDIDGTIVLKSCKI